MSIPSREGELGRGKERLEVLICTCSTPPCPHLAPAPGEERQSGIVFWLDAVSRTILLEVEQAACMKSQISMCADRGAWGGGGDEAAPNGRLSDTSALCLRSMNDSMLSPRDARGDAHRPAMREAPQHE